MFVEFCRNLAKFVEICIVLAKKTVVLCRFIAKNAVVFRQIIFLTSRKMLIENVVEKYYQKMLSKKITTSCRKTLIYFAIVKSLSMSNYGKTCERFYLTFQMKCAIIVVSNFS